MRKRRTKRVVQLTSQTAASLVRVRTKRKAKSRKRMTPKGLPAKLRMIRDSLGMSQGEIARELGVENRASISGYERGEREPPLPTLLKYARLAKVPLETLVDDNLKLPD